MGARSETIGLLFFREDERKIFQEALAQENFGVLAPKPSPEAIPELAEVDLIVVEDEVAKKFTNELLHLKNQAAEAFSFLPILVAQPYQEPSASWLSAGFDDVVPLPLVKPLLLLRVRTWLRLRKTTLGRFRDFVEESSFGFYRTTPDGRILYANPALIRMLGFSSLEELAQRNLEREGFGACTPRSQFKLLEREGRVSGYEATWIRKDGTRIYVRESARAVRDESGKTLYYEGVVEDITKERRLEERLAAIRDFGHRLVFSHSPSEIARAVVEAARTILGLEDVGLFLVNEERQTLDLVAHTLESVPKRPLPLGSPHGVVVRVARTGKLENIPDVRKEPAYIRTFEENRAELAVPLKVGQRVLGVLNVESPQIGAFGPEEEQLLTALADVTAIALENARLFQELKGLKRFHEGIVNTLAEGVVVVDPEGRILFANPAASEILGWSREEMLGKNWRELVAPLFHRQVEEELRRRREGKEGAYETLLLHKSGRHIPAFVHARPLFTDGQFHGAVKAFSDISQIKEFETRYRYFAEEIQEGYFLVRAKKPVPVDLPVEEQLRLIRENFYLAEANEAMARAYRLPSAQQILGRGFSELLCEEMFAQMRHLFEEFVRNNYKIRDRAHPVTLHNGEVRWFAYSAVGILEAGKLWEIWSIQRDITEQKKAIERLEKEARRFSVLYETGKKFALVRDLEEAFQTVHRAVAELMPAEAFVISLVRGEEAEAVYLFDKGGRYPPTRIPKGQGLTWHVLSTGQSLLVPDLAEAKGLPAIHFGSPEPVRSVLAVPLKVGERLIGVLSTQSYRPQAFTEDDLATLELLASQVAIALENIRLIKELEESEARFRRLAENAPDIIFRYRLKPTPGFEYVSPAVTRISGYTPEEHYADPDLIRKIVHPEDQPALEALGQGEGLFEKPWEFRWIHKDGHTVWTEQTNVPIRDEAGNIVAIEGIVRDITERKRLELERLARAQAIENALLQFVDALSSAVELRDPYTSGHQRRVAALAWAIAEEMGLFAEEIKVIRVAALLHDIGKALVVPIEILSKPGKLTDLEMALIREHPKAGYEILRKVEFPWPVAEIVYQHHERLDGSGYPRGLKGEEILREARIIAVADVVEAMSSHRPYRPALSVDEALAEIRKNAGKLYDPKVVEACIRVFAKGFTFPR